MASLSKSKFTAYAFEIGKWALVIWLLLPMRTSHQGPIEFSRVALGVILFVIFAGKLLYDTTFFRGRGEASSSGKDLLSMIGIVAGIAFLVLVLVLFVVFYVVNYMGQMRF